MTDPGLKVSGVRQLGDALGISKTRAAELSKQPWFPKKKADGSWNTLEVRQAHADFKAGLVSIGGPNADSPGIVAGAELTQTDDVLRGVLETSKNPEEIAKTTVQLVARTIARADELGVKHVLSMKSALEELRKGAAGYLRLAQERGELVSRDAALRSLGELTSTSVQAIERMANRFSGQHEIWLADTSHRSLSPEERKRRVEDWLKEQARAVRIEESSRYAAILDEHVKDFAR